MSFNYSNADFNVSVDKPMRILHVMPQLAVGGAQRQLYELIVHTNTSLARHVVFCYSNSRDEDGFGPYGSADISLTRIPRDKKHPIRFLRDFARIIKEHNPDIVHCWLYSGNIWGRWAALLAGTKNIIVAYRNCDSSYAPITRFLELFTTRKVHYLVNSQAGANYIGKKLGVDPKRFCVIYNGLDAQKFKIPSQRQHLFASLGIPNNIKIVTMVGRLMAQKNYPMFLKVAQKAKAAQLPLHFVAVGAGNLQDQLKTLAEQLNIDDIMHFLGVRNDIPEILRASDTFLFTTLYEGFPNAMLEAMAAQLPVITTNFAGVDELIEDGVNGTIVPVNDVKAAFAALKSYLDNPSKAQMFAAAAKVSVEQRFSTQVMVNKTLQFYHNIISGNNDAGM